MIGGHAQGLVDALGGSQNPSARGLYDPGECDRVPLSYAKHNQWEDVAESVATTISPERSQISASYGSAHDCDVFRLCAEAAEVLRVESRSLRELFARLQATTKNVVAFDALPF